MLGTREPEIYGSDTLSDIEQACVKHVNGKDINLKFKQSNHEGELISIIQESNANYDGIIINAAAYSHTSIGIFDALSLVNKPIVEIHLSNIYKREKFRHKSLISKLADGIICGFGGNGYIMAVDAITNIISNKK